MKFPANVIETWKENVAVWLVNNHQWLETQDACINLEVALSTYPHVTDVKWSFDEEYNK